MHVKFRKRHLKIIGDEKYKERRRERETAEQCDEHECWRVADKQCRDAETPDTKLKKQHKTCTLTFHFLLNQHSVQVSFIISCLGVFTV